MPNSEHPFPTALHANDAIGGDMSATIFVALQLSLTRWMVAASTPGEQKTSQHSIAACDGPALLALLGGIDPLEDWFANAGCSGACRDNSVGTTSIGDAAETPKAITDHSTVRSQTGFRECRDRVAAETGGP